MNRTTVQSIKEVGQVRVSKLSYKKIQLDYDIPIYSDGEPTDMKVNIKLRYNISDGNSLSVIYPKDKFYNSLSMRFAVKKKLLSTLYMVPSTQKLSVSVEGVEYSIDRIIRSINIDDKIWARDYKLNRLLNCTNPSLI